jgi:hypothetical protein
MQIRELRLIGNKKTPASVRFKPGANVISGASDTGKSYILRCIDFVLGAEELKKKIDEAAGYDFAQLEFEDADGNSLTLVRKLGGGDVAVHHTKIDNIQGDGTVVVWKRTGKSTAPDVTSVVLPFANMQEARLLASKKSPPIRLTLRTLLPAFLVDEGSIIAERSPIYSDVGFDNAARKRMFSYLLTGKDDSGIIVAERREIVQAEARAKIALISDLLQPLEARLTRGEPFKDGEQELTIDRADEAIERLTSSLAEDRQERARLQEERSDALESIQNAESQTIAIDELLARYRLLEKRYASDLERLDFVSEGSYFFDQLQDARCPLCDQVMDANHRDHVTAGTRIKKVYASAKAEAAKINGLKTDLSAAIESLNRRRAERQKELALAASRLREIDARIDRDLAPALHATKVRLDELLRRRLSLENVRNDTEQAIGLKSFREKLEIGLANNAATAAPKLSLDTGAIHKLCAEIESLLKEWSWKGEGKVTFEEKSCDVIVDGKSRQSHGKGVRAILHAAFIIGLLRYCHRYNMPHPRFVILDSPLTTFKQGRDKQDGMQKDVPTESILDEGIETNFWRSLTKLPHDLQIVVLDNKEPPDDVIEKISYEWFAGSEAVDDERRGYIPS